MKFYGQLEYAQFHNLSSNPSAGVAGKVWFNTTDSKVYGDDSVLVRAFIQNDQRAVFGNNGTAANNIRIHRGAAGVLQFVSGADVTAEGTLSTAISQISARHENYTDAGKPSAASAGRVVYVTDLSSLKMDTGAAWLSVMPLTTKGDIYTRTSTDNARLGVGTDGFSLVADSAQATGLKWASVISPDSSYEITNLGLAASVAANAMTVALKSKAGTDASSTDIVRIGFRNSTATTGTYVQRTVTAALSIVIPSGASLGMTDGNPQYVHVYALDNAGTVELGVAYQRLYDEGSLQTTTAISAGATSAFVLYSTTARSNVAIRYIGRVKSNQATAGTWASAPSEITLFSSTMERQNRSTFRMDTANGRGSTNTNLRFTTTTRNIGGIFTIADSATDGGSFTITETGTYEFQLNARNDTVGAEYHITLNSLTDPLTSTENMLANYQIATANQNVAVCSTARPILAGSVIRIYVTSGITANAFFVGTRVGD